MQGRYQGENPYTKAAIDCMRQLRIDPQNEDAYVQRAAAYAAIAQAIELENLGTIFGAVGVSIATGSFELEKVTDAILSLGDKA